jgi:hypothetical protein
MVLPVLKKSPKHFPQKISHHNPQRGLPGIAANAMATAVTAAAVNSTFLCRATMVATSWIHFHCLGTQ